MLLLLLAGSLYLGGVFRLFRTHAPRGRLRGVATFALGGVLLVAASGPTLATALLVAVVSGLTLAGLMLVARAMERSASRDDGPDLRLDVDPLRWR